MDKQRYRDYLDPPLGTLKLSDITPPMIGRILDDITKAGKSDSTLTNVRSLASSIFARGIEWGLAESNPVSGTKAKPKVHRDRFLHSEELPRFFVSLAEESNETVRDCFLVALLTGARKANVLEMRWSEIRLDEAIWRIPRTKNGTSQNVALALPVVDLLKARKASAVSGAEFVFTGEGESGHLEDPKKGWKRIFDRDELKVLLSLIESVGGAFAPKLNSKTGVEVCESLDARLMRARTVAKGLKLRIDDVRIRDVRIHDLRRTLGSWQAMTGASLPIIGKSLNHMSQQSTAIYARLQLDPVRSSVEKAVAAMHEAGRRE
jgi:integrase